MHSFCPFGQQIPGSFTVPLPRPRGGGRRVFSGLANSKRRDRRSLRKLAKIYTEGFIKEQKTFTIVIERSMKHSHAIHGSLAQIEAPLDGALHIKTPLALCIDPEHVHEERT